jgi:CTP:molybdopterin cytidylyltransferase MocA
MHATAFTAVVLAADRRPDDPLLKHSGASCKALLEIDGTPMVLRVIKALQESRLVDSVLLAGPAEQHVQASATLSAALAQQQVSWIPPRNSPSSSAYHAMQSLPDSTPVLITTADHPLLRADIVDHFLHEAQTSGADVAVALTSFAGIQAKFPHAKKTVLRFRDGGYCGCNLFAFMTPQSRELADAWRKVEQQRKNPLSVISQLGWWSVLRYLTGRLTLAAALQQLSKRLNLNIHPVMLPFPESAIDVDSIADQQLVEGITGNSS